MSFVKSNIWFYFRTYQDSNTLFTCNVDIPKFLANSAYCRVCYNYVVVHESSEETSEQVPFSYGASGAAINRVIQVHSEDLKKGKISSDN